MAASVVQIKQKRQREDFSEEYQNLHKRSRDGLLSEFFTADDGDCEAVEDDLVLQVVKSLQEEINGTSDKGENSRLNGEVGERVIISAYEDLVNTTDDQLGISPSSRISGEEDDNEGISNEFWSDLFENPSNCRGESEDLLHPFLSHCYSYNNRNYAEYNALLLSEDQQEWIQESFTDLASQGFLTLF